MTADERKTALVGVKRKVREHAAEQNKPYNEAKAKLKDEFWSDARKELAYDSFLDDEGVKALESKADEEGHASGYSEVFYQLETLSDFAEKMVKSAKNPVRNLIKDKGLYFLASPDSTDYIEVASMMVVGDDSALEDENGEQLPAGATVLFPN